MTLVSLLHGFFSFLGTLEGELFKTAIELVLFVIVDYMVISEWTRHRRKELQFLIVAFSVMVIQKIFSVYFLANATFTSSFLNFHYLRIFDNLFEVFALFLIANAFAYPIIKQKRLRTRKFIKKTLLLLLPSMFVLCMFVLSILDLKGGSLDAFWTNTSMNVAEIVILLYYAAYLMVNTKYPVKYRANIVFAFVIYTITPTIELFNIILYNNLNKSLVVASHPFPFISVLIITQVIYLKLVDKATILYKLRESERRYKQEKELSKLKDEFISTVSHELRTPLTSMKLYVSLLKDNKLGKTTKRQREALAIINEEANRLNKLITDILDLSRFEARKMKLNLITFDLNDIVKNKLYLAMAKEKKVKVVINVPDKFMVLADKDKINQVFVNLFSNALKFTPEGGTIVLSAAMYPAEWRFEISDTGRGVEKKMLPKLFDKFYQAEDFMIRTQGGIGLGLAIVKSIIDLHKGKIGVESELGKGTKITIRIPKDQIY